MEKRMQYNDDEQMLSMMMQAQQQAAMRQQQQVSQQTTSSPSEYSRVAYHQKPTFVTRLNENDVLLGRGTPCAEHTGNVRFRRLVKERKLEYIAAEKRIRKDAIAREILETIASRGGHFLRKVENRDEYEGLGVTLNINTTDIWAIVDEDTKTQKVKQALRNKDDMEELEQLKTKTQEQDEADEAHYNVIDISNQYSRGVREDHMEGDRLRANSSLPLTRVALDRRVRESSKSGTAKFSESNDPRPPFFPSKPTLEPRGENLDSVSNRYGGLSAASSIASPKPRPSAGRFLNVQTRQRSDLDEERSLFAGRRGMIPRAGLPHAAGDAPTITNRQLWEQSRAATGGNLQSSQDLQRMRALQQMGPPMEDPTVAFASRQYSQVADSDYRQLQARQRQFITSREAGSIRNAPLSPQYFGGPGTGIIPSPMHMASASQAQVLGMRRDTSAGEHAISLAIARRRTGSFSSVDSLALSHSETLILSVVCFRGLPVWTPDAYATAFSKAHQGRDPKKLDWNWYAFAESLKEESLIWQKKLADTDTVAVTAIQFAVRTASEYIGHPKELAKQTVMLLEKLRLHVGAEIGSKSLSGLGARVPAWLERELSRWAATLNIDSPTGRPFAFSSGDFVLEHPHQKHSACISASAVLDPLLADDIVDQAALITRLRGIFASNRGLELRAKMEQALKTIDNTSDADNDVSQEMLLCERLMSDGFRGVLTSSSRLDSVYQFTASESRPYHPFESLGLNKSVLQYRASLLTRELHVMEESAKMKNLWKDRVQRLVQAVREVEANDGATKTAAGSGSPRSSTSGPLKKRSAGDTGTDSSQQTKKTKL